MVYDYWQSGKRLLIDPNFAGRFESLDPESLSNSTVEKLKEEFMGCPELQESILAKISPVAEAIMKWIDAIIQYSGTMKVIPTRIIIFFKHLLIENLHKLNLIYTA